MLRHKNFSSGSINGLEGYPVGGKNRFYNERFRIRNRIGVRIYANIAKTETKACEITALSFQKQSPLEIVTTIKNTGNIPISLAGEVQIVDSSNNER